MSSPATEMTPSFWPSPPTTELLPAAMMATMSRPGCSCAAKHNTSSRTPGKRSRKCASPHRSIPRGVVTSLTRTQKRKQGFVKLDVYAAFMSQPQRLLFDRSARKRAVLEWKERQENSMSDDVQNKVVKRKRGRPGRKTTSVKPAEFTTTSVFVPTSELDTVGAPVVSWTKGEPLDIHPSSPGYDLLTREEVRTCCTLRLTPETYLRIKATLIAAREERGVFKKRDAQKWCRVDVNKTGKLYDWFVALGWLQGAQ
ncbi:Homeodomain-like protein [Powellomyces hirtus]|nr:Homeodomain-like protein [Powellomyces hirtus]